MIDEDQDLQGLVEIAKILRIDSEIIRAALSTRNPKAQLLEMIENWEREPNPRQEQFDRMMEKFRQAIRIYGWEIDEGPFLSKVCPKDQKSFLFAADFFRFCFVIRKYKEGMISDQELERFQDRIGRDSYQEYERIWQEINQESISPTIH